MIRVKSVPGNEEIKRKIAEVYPGQTLEEIAELYVESGREAVENKDKISLLDAYFWGLKTRPGHVGLVESKEEAGMPFNELRRKKRE